MIAKPRAIILFEASATLGGGHMARCLALAAVMRREFEVDIASNISARGFFPIPDGCRMLPSFADGEPSTALDCIEPGDRAYDVAITDHYGLGADFEGRLRTIARRIVVIDDLANRRHDCDVLIDTSPGPNPQRYAQLTPQGCLLLLGGSYAMLRPGFRQVARIAPRCAATVQPERFRILVSLGATDPGNATAKVLADLCQTQCPIRVTVMLAAMAPHRQSVAKLLPQLPYPAELTSPSDDPAELYASHDLAIGAPATSALERAAAGLPSVLVVTADNQLQLASALERSGAALVIGPVAGLAPAGIANAVDLLRQSPDEAVQLADRARRLVDGLGAERVAALLSPWFVTRDGRPLGARPLEAGDCELLLEWQSDPSTRAFARNQRVPTPAEHSDWMRRRLASRNCLTEIVLLDSRPAAIVRIDPTEAGPEISIVVAPGQTGLGIGTAAIRYIEALHGGERFVAWVHPRNEPSLALFRRLGYGTRPGRELRELPLREFSL